MGLANWVMGKMVDRFLAQPPEEKAAMFDTMATRFWEAATPEEIAQISELMLPRFIDTFLNGATAEQKAEMMRTLITSDSLRDHVKELLPGLLEGAMKTISTEQRQELMQSVMDPELAAKALEGMLPALLESAVKSMPADRMQRLLSSAMPGFGSAGAERPDDAGAQRPQPPRPPGGMMPW